VDEFFLSGRAIDVVLGVLALEAVVLLATRARHGLGPLDVLGQLLAGALLLVALRCALTGASVLWIAALLTAALPVSLYDLLRRVRAGRRGP
jgi:hypothetical protein